MKHCPTLAVLVTLSITTLNNSASAASIYAINTGLSNDIAVVDAISQLNFLGNTVTTGSTLADYSAYDQVWDLRYNQNLGPTDVTAMGNYLASGGRMFLSGEQPAYTELRNASLVDWVEAVGGGSMTLVNVRITGDQPVTTAGQIVAQPNQRTFLRYYAANSVSTPGTGFMVTETQSGLGHSSLIGWDFGDIIGSPNARMLVGFDINLFRNSSAWAENMVHYLGGDAPPPVVPEPSTYAMAALGLLGLGLLAWRRKHANRSR